MEKVRYAAESAHLPVPGRGNGGKRHSHADIPQSATAFGTDGSGWAGERWVQIGLFKLGFKVLILCEPFLKLFLLGDTGQEASSERA